jgi:small GTP-binding protein
MTDIIKVKTVIIGDSGSGKSCFINRLTYNKYNQFSNTTIGTQFLIKEIGNFKLEIWDTGGQEKYRSLIPMYLRNALIVCVVISLDKNSNLIEDEKQFWLNYINNNNTMSKHYKKILIYNKCDLNKNFILQIDERFDLNYIISCKTNEGIIEFTQSLGAYLSNIKETIETQPLIEININSKSYLSKKCIKCCLL